MVQIMKKLYVVLRNLDFFMIAARIHEETANSRVISSAHILEELFRQDGGAGVERKWRCGTEAMDVKGERGGFSNKNDPMWEMQEFITASQVSALAEQ